MKPKVFISHTDRVFEDKAFTDILLRRFKEVGIPYWIDREHPISEKMAKAAAGPAPENPLFYHLCNAIADSDVIIFVVSRTSIKREFVRLEFDPRILYGPAARIMENQMAVMVLLDTPDNFEITTVLSILCGRNNVIRMEEKTFDSFWKHFEKIYLNATILSKDNSWRQKSNFAPRPRPKNSKTIELKESSKKGDSLFKQAIECIGHGRFEHAEELLADAYQAFLKANDPRAIAQVLYQSFKVHLHFGIKILQKEREIFDLNGMVIKDSYILGLEYVVYALKCLEGSIAHYAKAGDQALAIKMAELIKDTEDALKDAGIQNAKAMLAACQQNQVKSVMDMLANPPSDFNIEINERKEE